MEFWDWVLVGVVVAAIVGTWRWLWMRRRRPLDWVAAGKAAVERRRRRIAAARHEELVEWVLDRAKTLNKDVPVAVERRPEFDVVTVHPSGRQLFYVRNHEDYARLLGSGLPHNTDLSAEVDRATGGGVVRRETAGLVAATQRRATTRRPGLNMNDLPKALRSEARWQIDKSRRFRPPGVTPRRCPAARRRADRRYLAMWAFVPAIC